MNDEMQNSNDETNALQSRAFSLANAFVSSFVIRHWNFIRHSRFRISNFRRCVIALMLGTTFLAGGCGYQMMGVNHASLYRQDIQTVAVPIFLNRTYRQGLETELTKSIIQQLEEHSPYKVVPKDRADTILEGEIVTAPIDLLNPDSTTGLPQEQQYTLVINFVWKNLRTGDILVQRRNFDQRESFFPTLGESASVGSTNTIQQLALAVVNEMQADW
jgi:Lipopolysaccharide-assembly